MRCPVCKARVRDEDALQIHYMESCDAIGDEADAGVANEDDRKVGKSELVEDLVEVVFKWVDTKDTTQQTIVLISSQAGQIKLRKKLTDNSYKSAKVIVPCGVHSCQLVVDEECYPVVDVSIDPSSEIVHIILQDDVESEDRGESSKHYYNKSSESTPPLQQTRTGAMQQDEINADYARGILDDIARRDRAGTPTEDEVASVSSYDSKSEKTRTKRRERKLESLVSGEKKNLTGIAKNGVHQVQVHTAGDTAVLEDEFLDDKQTGYGDEMRQGYTMGDLVEYSKGSIPERLNRDELLITPPSGFQTSSDPRQKTGTRRLKTLSKIANSRVRGDSLSDQGSFSEKDNGVGPSNREGNMVLDEKPSYSWGYDDERRSTGQGQASNLGDYKETDKDADDEYDKRSDTSYTKTLAMNQKTKTEQRISPTSEEIIPDLIRKCDIYKLELEKAEKENEQLQKQLDGFLEKSRDHLDEMLNKDEKIEELQAKCESYESEMGRIKKESSDLKNEFVKFQEENDTKIHEEIDMLEKKLESILRDNKELKEENESLQTANKLQREDMDRIIEDELVELKSKFDNVKVGTRSFEYENMEKIRGLDKEVENLKEENRTLRKQLSRIKKEVNMTEKIDRDGAGFEVVAYASSEDAVDYSSRIGSRTEPSETRARQHGIQRSRSEYDKNYRPPILPDYKSFSRDTHDRNQNHILNDDLATTRLRSTLSRHHESSSGQAASPIRAAHFDYLGNYENSSRYMPRETADDLAGGVANQVFRRERTTRRERPRSYHGISSASENDSRHLSRNLAAYQHDDPDPYTFTLSSGYDMRLTGRPYSTSPEASQQNLKPFAPRSIDEVMIGMRVLITRSSGRVGKGIIKWKGHLAGHKEPFIGVELETPNGKHDGVYDDCRYFHCKKDHGVFSKFSKVVMVWGAV